MKKNERNNKMKLSYDYNELIIMRRFYFETLHNKCIFYSNHMIMINNLHYLILVIKSLSGPFFDIYFWENDQECFV